MIKRYDWTTPHGHTIKLARAFSILGLCALLAACASGPRDTISLIPSEIAQETSKDGLFIQAIEWVHTKPGCKGECPSISLNSLVFPGNKPLTELVDHALAAMTWLDQTQAIPYFTVAEFEQYFWPSAAPRDEVTLQARARYRNRNLTVLELSSGQYRTGMAHGITGSQFINWDNQTAKVLGLDNILIPGARQAYVQALQQAHTQWLHEHAAARDDPDTFSRIWPFQSSDNFAFTDQGLVIKYQPYQIAPYSSGQPELLLLYPALRGILQPRFLPDA
ncbi:RsiV family protein [Alcaligenaceae bacterium CGII-47]|nr:RsiV family protein [Alcaligenaceae bacterium CGII-47]